MAARRFVDLSVPLQAGIASDPPGHLPEIDYYNHRQTAAEVVSFFPGATVEDLPDGEGWAIQLPARGFEVACFPVKIHAASAGWTRAVAIFSDSA